MATSQQVQKYKQRAIEETVVMELGEHGVMRPSKFMQPVGNKGVHIAWPSDVDHV